MATKEKPFQKKFISLLEKHLKNDGSFVSFAGVIGVSNNTLYRLVQKHPEFAAVRDQFKKPTRRSIYEAS